MVLNFDLLLAILVFGTPVLILFFFLPAFVELRKPKDCGPRIIMENLPRLSFSIHNIHRLEDFEEERIAESCLAQVLKVIEFLTNVEQ